MAVSLTACGGCVVLYRASQKAAGKVGIYMRWLAESLAMGCVLEVLLGVTAR
jgi:hypothetical protein